ncbi:MAG: hypothetical protein KatS3mg087_1605 [Patescibacteria group bacterium]|nr:MAG: hypothetical protein KatS3mg087_1605 [Patescibacteria group bacterium]
MPKKENTSQQSGQEKPKRAVRVRGLGGEWQKVKKDDFDWTIQPGDLEGLSEKEKAALLSLQGKKVKPGNVATRKPKGKGVGELPQMSSIRRTRSDDGSRG